MTWYIIIENLFYLIFRFCSFLLHHCLCYWLFEDLWWVLIGFVRVICFFVRVRSWVYLELLFFFRVRLSFVSSDPVIVSNWLFGDWICGGLFSRGVWTYEGSGKIGGFLCVGLRKVDGLLGLGGWMRDWFWWWCVVNLFFFLI